MDEKTSVVTPERFSSGFTYKDYIAQIKVNSDRFEQYYQTVEVSQDDADFFKKAVEAGVTKMLVLGEDWCPDVFRGMPVTARISEASGMELRVFPRDENLDIMNEFLKDGEFQSIPTVVLYDKDHSYLGHWIERPAKANEERAQIEAEVKQKRCPAHLMKKSAPRPASVLQRVTRPGSRKASRRSASSSQIKLASSTRSRAPRHHSATPRGCRMSLGMELNARCTTSGNAG